VGNAGCGIAFEREERLPDQTDAEMAESAVKGMLVRRFAPNLAEQIFNPVGRVGSVLLLMGLACAWRRKR
jgi:hypothetical protein